MKPLLSILLSFSACVCDALIVAALLRAPEPPNFVLGAIASHWVVAIIGAGAVAFVAPPPSAARSRGWFFVVAFVVAWFVPVLGPLGLQLVASVGLTAKPKDGGDPWVVLDVDEELSEQGFAVKRRGVSASRIASILGQRGPEDAERRFAAILQVRHLPPNRQVQILQLALKDSSDEVRLFAFSRIEKFRTDLETKIKQFSTELAKADPREGALLHLRLAESFHEIAYLRLAEGAVLDHALEEAYRHAAAAKQLRPESGPADYLLGRILLRRNQHDHAILAFQSAVRQHYPRAKIIPYMAECAFRQGRYDVVRTMLTELARVTRGQSALEPLVDFWR